MAFKGSSKKIPIEFADVQLCREMNCTYWELQEQPSKFVELFSLYLQIKSKVEKEQSDKLDRMKNKTSRRRRGR